MKPNNSNVWLITGISRGLGFELAKAALAEGDVVIGTTRDGTVPLAAPPGTLHVFPLEVTRREEIRGIVERAHALHGQLDIIVNNAGYGLLGAIEEATPEETSHVFDVNFFGPLELVRTVLPFLRSQRSGHIVNISSIAGLAPMAGSGLYAAAKFALEGMSETLAQELEPLGIHVTLVEPGAFRTDFLSVQSARKTAQSIGDYAVTSGRNIAYLDSVAGKQPGDPLLGARAIIQATKAGRPPLHLVLGTDALRRTRTKLHALSTELDRWERVSTSTDFAS